MVMLRRGERLCEQCGYPTAGFLRMTTRIDGALVQACEDCALDLEREKDREADVTFDDALGAVCDVVEAEREAAELKR